MASKSQGIQQLLQAEKKAETMVSDARKQHYDLIQLEDELDMYKFLRSPTKRKTQKLKRAKEEAQAEIKSYKEDCEKQFSLYQKEHMGSKDDHQAKVEEQTNTRLSEISTSVQQNKDKVIERLLSLVYDIKPELHQNLKIG